MKKVKKNPNCCSYNSSGFTYSQPFQTDAQMVLDLKLSYEHPPKRSASFFQTGFLLVLCLQNGAQAAPGLAEDTGIHLLQVGRNLRLEVHVGQDVLLQIHAGGDLHQRDLAVDQAEHGALGDVHDLLILRGKLAGEGDLAHVLYELADPALFQDLELAVAHLQFGLAHEGAAEDDFRRGAGDVDETAGR